MDSKYLRIVASSYYVLAHIISQLKEDELKKSAQQYSNLFDHDKFWANLCNENSAVRKSCYSLIKVLVNRCPCKNIFLVKIDFLLSLKPFNLFIIYPL